MMLRLLLMTLAVGIAFVLIRDAMRRRRTRNTTLGAPVATVRCARCGIHLPAQHAFQHADGRQFCSPEHARDDG